MNRSEEPVYPLVELKFSDDSTMHVPRAFFRDWMYVNNGIARMYPRKPVDFSKNTEVDPQVVSALLNMEIGIPVEVEIADLPSWLGWANGLGLYQAQKAFYDKLAGLDPVVDMNPNLIMEFLLLPADSRSGDNGGCNARWDLPLIQYAAQNFQALKRDGRFWNLPESVIRAIFASKHLVIKNEGELFDFLQTHPERTGAGYYPEVRVTGLNSSKRGIVEAKCTSGQLAESEKKSPRPIYVDLTPWPTS